MVVDPPYGNNVMYAELSDFFYVWLKRSVGDLYPGWFDSELVDKDAEAVANPCAVSTSARGGKSKELGDARLPDEVAAGLPRDAQGG